MESLYQIPLIPQDLRQEENILQIADILDHLQNVIDDIFIKLNNRIDENVKRTRMIQSRINACSDKVERLSGTNKATRVICSAKYPAMDCHENIESVFKGTTNMDIVRTHRDIKMKPVVYSESELQDKLEFYHVKVSGQNPMQTIMEASLPRHHDKLPAEVRAVGCLMVYGSDEMVYGSKRGDVGVGGATSVQAAREVIERGPPSPLHDPPTTVVTRETHKMGQHLYLYSPNMEEVPTMNMPHDLPDLPGVAGDMRFYLDSEPTIAPSARVQMLASLSTVLNDPGPRYELKPAPLVSPSQEVAILPKSEIGAEENTFTNAPTRSVAPRPQAVPPPPPPPPPAPPVEETDFSTSNKSHGSVAADVKLPTIPASLDSRAGLMEAIRKAGGSGKAHLRSVIASSAVAKADSSNKVASGGGDLMADLHAKLSMRRKGISGARQGGAEGTILAAISAIIPPPTDVDPQSNSEVSSAEDDWE